MRNYFELYPTQKSPEVFSAPSKRMMSTLKDCLQMETNSPGKPYGPADIHGSFFGLYKRGLLDFKSNHENKLKTGSWYITSKGLLLLLINIPSRAN